MNPGRAWVERNAVWIAGLITLIVGLSTMTSEIVGVFFDDAVYLLVGKAIAAGDGLVYPHLPGTPAAIHYPPLFPLLLSLIWRVAPEFPANVVWFKLLNPLLLAGAAVGAFRVATALFGVRPLIALGVVVAAAASVPVNVLTTVVLSEPLFLVLLFPAFLAAERARVIGGSWVVVAALAGAALVLTRTIGGVVVIATVIVFAQERRWRGAAIYTSVVALALLPWQLFVWRHAPEFVPELRGSFGPYLEWILEGYRQGGVALLADVITKNAVDAWFSVGVMVSPLARGVPREVLTALAVAVLGWGLLAGARRTSSATATLALAGYLAFVLIWPYRVERFVWGIWPLILLVAYDGARDLHARSRRAHRPRAAVAVAISAVLLVGGYTVYNVRGFALGWESSASRSMAALLLPIVQYVNSDPRLHGKIISTEASPLVALYSGEIVVPAEILAVRDHVAQKTRLERAIIIGAIDRRFRPDAYVLMSNGPYLPALLEARFDPGRRFLEISPPGLQVRAFHILP